MNNLPLFYTKSYLQFQQECEEAFNWCKAKSPKLNKNHRFTKYRQNLQKLIDAKQAGTTHQLLGSISPEDLSTSLCALNELVIIYRGLSPLINRVAVTLRINELDRNSRGQRKLPEPYCRA